MSKPSGVYLIKVAIPRPVDILYSYSSHLELSPGIRVWIPFGKNHLVGLVWECAKIDSSRPETEKFKIKPLSAVLDQNSVIPSKLQKLATFLSAYYCCPLGEVLRNMLPGKLGRSITPVLTRLSTTENPECSKWFRGRKQIKEATLRTNLQKQGFDPSKTIEDWIETKALIRSTTSENTSPTSVDNSLWEDKQSKEGDFWHPLNPSQIKASQQIEQQCKATVPSPVLFFGVTGSGKTRVFMEAIRQLQSQDPCAQVLVLIPEISLTPQLTARFLNAFGQRTGCVHSNLPAKKREDILAAAQAGELSILIGPRSSVFAGFANLKMIIVDEEHDNSYKQNTRFAYHGRDVAVMRGHLEQIPVLLASATPSLESLQNSIAGKYKLVQMKERVANAKLPTISVLSAPASSPSKAFGLSHYESPIHPDIIKNLQKTLDSGEQAMILVGRRGYANYLYNLTHKTPVLCKNCDLSLTFHEKRQQLSCHHCGYLTVLDKILAATPQENFAIIGQGSQRIEAMLQEQLPTARIARLDSDTAGDKDKFFTTISDFKDHQLDILVGTQMIAKGHDFPGVTSAVLLQLDSLLHFPDFRAGEQAAQLMIQAAGRAGRGERPGQVYIQCLDPEHTIFSYVKQHDYLGFAQHELTMRAAHGFPPFEKQGLFQFEAKDPRLLEAVSQKMALKMRDIWQSMPSERQNKTRLVGPTQRSVHRKAGYYGKQILISADKPSQIFGILKQMSTLCEDYGSKVRYQVDMDPVNYS